MLKKVMLIEEYSEGSTYWRIPCDCGDKEHDIELMFDVDDDGFASLNLSGHMGFYQSSWYSNEPWYERLWDWRRRMWRRVKASAAMLFKGHYQMDGDVILTKDGIAGLRYALDEGERLMDVKIEENIKRRQTAKATNE